MRSPTPKAGVGHRDFLVLWSGQTHSAFGSAISLPALPSIAILLLHASAWQLGLLEALAYAAFPMLGLVVGAGRPYAAPAQHDRGAYRPRARA